NGLRFEVTRFERVDRALVSMTMAVDCEGVGPPVRLGESVEVTDAREDGEHHLHGVVEASAWKRRRDDGAGELALRVRVHRRFRRVKRATGKVEGVRRRGGPDRRRRVTVPDKMVTGCVSSTDIVTYLLATGWWYAYEPTFYERVVRGEKRTVQAPFDDPRVDE